ncbi:MAG: cupin domain-containing protein [Cephaloticoccus sp.]|nr:cupin domain-containing protein [Cephaloticoccus sp.]MCF7761793.1 cupin domain-containing protein [Cephaloticoccus sp.]
MIIKGTATSVSETRNCHGGTGLLTCRELYGDYLRADAGIKFVHDDVIEPGASIGEHLHNGDEEFYYILEGTGEMTLDGAPFTVQPGDFCFTQNGHRHSLRNTGAQPMRFLVVCVNREISAHQPDADHGADDRGCH